MTDHHSLPTDHIDADDDQLHVEEQRFSVVPEWVIDAELSDAAFRLYCLLLRYGNGSGRRMPSRATLAGRLHRSKDSLDRAMRELVAGDVVRVERRHNGTTFLSNRYYVRTTDPAPPVAATRRPGSGPWSPPARAKAGDGAPVGQTPWSGGGRKSAATPEQPVGEPGGGGRNSAATPGRISAATLAADLRPDRKKLTEKEPPPPPTPSAAVAAASPVRSTAVEEELVGPLLAECGITDIDGLSRRCAHRRVALGHGATRWQPACLVAALQLAVRVRGWPAHLAEPALLAIAADPATRSPMRLGEAGPWWDTAAAPELPPPPAAELAALEARLDDTDGLRVRLQAEARRQLAAEGVPVTRTTVVRRACQVLDQHAASGWPLDDRTPHPGPVPAPKEHSHA